MQMFIEHGFHMDFRITSTGITLYSLLMGVDSTMLQEVESRPKKYVQTLRMLLKKEFDLRATDDLGRNCIHHAAMAGNMLGC